MISASSVREDTGKPIGGKSRLSLKRGVGCPPVRTCNNKDLNKIKPSIKNPQLRNGHKDRIPPKQKTRDRKIIGEDYV